MARKAAVKKEVKIEAKSKIGASSIDVVKKNIQKKYGDVVKPMSEKPLIVNTISTRSLGLDLAIGRGGFAKGRVYEVFGPNSGGKTTLTMSLIAEAQRRGMRALFVDSEHSADGLLFKKMGVNTELLEVIEAYTGEENLDAAEQFMQTGEFDLIVIDSVTALIPQAAADAEIADQHMALLARLMSKTLLRYVPIAAKTNTCVIFINQIRSKVGIIFGSPETTPGGLGLGFYTTGRVRVSGVGNKANRIVDEKGVVIGHKTLFEIQKNKLEAPFKTAQVDLIYGQGYDMVGEVITMATDLGLLVKSGSWYSYEDKNIGQGESGVRKFFEELPDVFINIKESLENILGLDVYYKAQEAYDQDKNGIMIPEEVVD